MAVKIIYHTIVEGQETTVIVDEANAEVAIEKLGKVLDYVLPKGEICSQAKDANAVNP